MSLTVITPAESQNLTVADNINIQLGQAVGTDDTILNPLIAAVSSEISQITHAVWGAEEVEELVKAQDDIFLLLSRRPVYELVSISLNGDILLDVSIEDYESGILYRDAGFYSESNHYGIAPQAILNTNRSRYKVRYKAGYNLPSFTVPLVGPDALPPALEQIAIDWVIYSYTAKKEGRSSDVTSIKIGDYQKVFSSSSAERSFTAQIAERLVPWTRLL